MTDHPIIVFGLDGACFDLIQPWLDDGSMPTLQGLIEHGGRTPLESCVPATTPPAWTSLTTGVNPGKHGVFGFYSRRRDSYDVDPVSDRGVQARRLWDYTTEAGLTSLVVNVPVTHPAREIDGVLVPGYVAPNEPETYPEGVLAELGMEAYRVYADSEAADVPEEQLCEEWLKLTESRRDLALALMERYDWDLLFLEFQKTDGAVHKFGDDENVRRIYERVDECMAAVLDAVEEEPNVFVVSDHGIGQEKEWSIALNTWLVEEGFAETTVGGTGAKTGSWMDGTDDGTAGETSPVGPMLSGLSRVGLTKQRVERVLSAAGLYETVARLAPKGIGSGLEEEVVDEAACLVFYQGIGFSGVDVGVTINDARFYEDGIVGEDEYEAVRSEVMDALSSLEGPDGRRPFDRVRRREEVYEGPATECAPDVVLEQSPEYVIGSKQPRGQTFIPAEEGRIDHTRNGLLVTAGPDVESGWSLDRMPSIVDVTPTLLALLGVSLDERFDGKALTGVLAGDGAVETQAYGPVERPGRHEFGADEEEALEARLKGMGYLE